MSHGRKPFRFEGCWVRDVSSKDVVARAWGVDVRGSASFRLVQKFKATKVALVKWNREVFRKVQSRIKALQNRLTLIQMQEPSDSTWEAEQNIQVDLSEALKQEECIRKQKSRVD